MSFTLQDSLAPQALTHGRAEAALAGDTLAGRYDVLELLGCGGMGAVYRARDRELDELVALKVIRRELAAMPAMVERFRHEVKLARRVTHVNVARTFELGTSDGMMFCSMELIEGQSLATRLAQRGALSVGEAVAIACAMCDGLAAAHGAGVIHRDIKPDNVLIAHDGRVVLADFGVAAIGAAAAGELSGTPAYMAPEQARGEAPTAAADVYAVGLVLYEMLTGQRAFLGDTTDILVAKQQIESMRPKAHDLPAALIDVIAGATARDLDRRVSGARALRTALEPWASSMRQQPQSQRVSHVAGELTTVVVHPPRTAGVHPQLYLAVAVQEQVLAILAKKPRVRVLPRASRSGAPPAFEVSFELAQSSEDRPELIANIAPEHGPPIRLVLPLEASRVQQAAETIIAAIDAGRAQASDADPQLAEAQDLLLLARFIAYRDFTRMSEVIELLERAHELAPQDMRIAASVAIAYIRAGFFTPAAYPGATARARVLATAAVTHAPELADGHIACGHLELTTGHSTRAASHFRIAIARAPQLAEAHEQLGRMLLEAGYLDAALARLDEALAIAPELRSAHWEIGRALALEGRWAEHDRMIGELLAMGLDRPLSRARYAWWRGQWDVVAEQRARVGPTERILWPGLIDALFDIFLDKASWSAREDELMQCVRMDSPNRRRRVFVAQLACEAAAFAGDTRRVVDLLEWATEDGLFDLHWLDRCVLLAPFRQEPGVVAVRARIAERATAILDALYGDHAAAMSETQVA